MKRENYNRMTILDNKVYSLKREVRRNYVSKTGDINESLNFIKGQGAMFMDIKSPEVATPFGFK